MSGPPQSALFDTGVRDLGKVAAAGNLGNEYQRKNRGRYQAIMTGQGAVRLVDVVGDDQLATQTTITCSLESAAGSRADNASASDLPEVLGVIHWGTDGAAHTAEFDWLRGTVLTVAASSIRVDVQIEHDPAELGSVLARASIGYMPRPGRGPQRTFGATLDPAALALYPIPAFAARVIALRAAADPADPPSLGALIGLTWLDGSGAPIGIVITVGAASMPIPNGAVSLQVTNASTVAQTHRAIFELVL
jgi:hypothetical protein